MPIVTVINLETHQSTPSRHYNWKKVDLCKLKEFLQQEVNQDPSLNNIIAPAPIGSLEATVEIDNQLDALTPALTSAIAESTPLLNFSSWSRPGFTEECKEAQQRARWLKKEWKKTPTLETWEAFRSARNFKGTLIQKAMRNAFRKAVAEACTNEKTMWKFSKWARTRTSSHQAAMPEIEGETVPSQKALRFQQAFFPDAPVTANDDLQNYVYKDAYKTPESIGVNEIYSAINQLFSGRAPGEDNIPSEILKATVEIIMPHYIACLTYVIKIATVQAALKSRSP